MFGSFDLCLRRFCLAWFLLAVVPVVAGPLQFDVVLREVDAKADQDQVPASFPFHNPHDEAVEIVEFRSGCSACLKAGPKQVVQPGAKSVVDTIFRVGAVAGELKKSVTVVMRDASGAFFEQALTVKVNVPELVRVTPKKQEWKIGGEGDERVFDVTIPGDDPIHVLAARCTRPSFKIDVEEVEKGRHYRIKVVPTVLDAPQLGLLKIETDCAIEKYKNHIVFVAVRQ